MIAGEISGRDVSNCHKATVCTLEARAQILTRLRIFFRRKCTDPYLSGGSSVDFGPKETAADTAIRKNMVTVSLFPVKIRY